MVFIVAISKSHFTGLLPIMDKNAHFLYFLGISCNLTHIVKQNRKISAEKCAFLIIFVPGQLASMQVVS